MKRIVREFWEVDKTVPRWERRMFRAMKVSILLFVLGGIVMSTIMYLKCKGGM